MPLAHAIAVAVATGSALGGTPGNAQAEQAFSPAWFAARGAAQNTATTTGRLPNGMPVSTLSSPSEQQRLANAQLQQSVANLGAAAQALAAQQALQAAARQAAQSDLSAPDGLTQGGLKVDTDSLTRGWINANTPTQSVADGRTTVTVQQTADKAILNWETFNVGKNTAVNFAQQKDWAVLNRVNDPQAAPSRIQGQIRGDGTVMIVNRNGVVFTGTSQVDTRNLVVAAANITDDQFQRRGIYGANAATPTFTDAVGKVVVQPGARLATRESASVTQGGGYVMLLGSAVDNAGEIAAPRGQALLAAGDSFIIRRGVGTDGNTASTTRGNEIAPQFTANSTAGAVVNRGLIVSREGDITLTGRDVSQLGVAISSTTVNNRGTVHLLNSASDTKGRVTLGPGATTAVLIEDDGSRALDSQRAALLQASLDQDANRGLTRDAFDNLSRLSDRRDQSRVEVVSGADVLFDSGSLTLATGGQIAVSAARRSFVASRATLDVSGAVGVNLSMDSNNVKVNVQGNEQRDAPRNRDTGDLLNANVWIDRRRLVYVPAGTGGYTSERWYTSNGLLEVGGYLGNQGHGIGEWAAQGGTVVLGGKEVVTQAGSKVNLSGGTLDVQTGYLNQTWLKGADGNLYNINTAPADTLFKGVYRGFESEHARWGKNTTETFYSPLIGAQRVLENGYTVGRDAGQLLVSAPTAVLEGDIATTVFNGARQTNAASAAIADGYQQSQTAVAREARLAFGQYGGLGRVGAFESDVTIGRISDIASNLGLTDALAPARVNTIWLDATRLNAQRPGGIDIATRGKITLDAPLTLADGGTFNLVAPVMHLNADVTARGGQVSATNTFVTSGTEYLYSPDGRSEITVAPGRAIDVRGLWTNTRLDPSASARLAYVDGGNVTLRSTLDVAFGKGAVIDVSSGAALLPTGKLRGGKGGNVTVSADDGGNGSGTLTLDGDVRGFGVTGGGTLSIGTGQPVALSSTPILPDGRLRAGQAAPVDLQLGADFVVAAGAALPFSYMVTLTKLGPGDVVKAGEEPVTLNPTSATPLIPQSGWVVPSSMTSVTIDGTLNMWPGQTVPAGSRITSVNGPLPDGYVIPATAFPNGVSIKANVTSYTAGTRMAADFVIRAGTVVPSGTSIDREIAVRPVFTLAPSAFAQGFGTYAVNAHSALAVTSGTRLDVAMPVLRLTDDASRIATGDNPEGVWNVWLPPQYLVDAAKGTVTRRGGADVVLQSTGTGGSGHLNIDEGAAITVDTGRHIGLESRGQINIDGALHAPGGTIDVTQFTNAYLARTPATASPGQRSILIGDHAVLDVAGRAATVVDEANRRYSEVPNGGAISIGAPTDRSNPATLARAAESFIVVRPGAVLDASGGSAVVDLPGSAGTLTLAGNGGSIAFNSFNGLYLDGTMRAAAGGPGALGGTLFLTLETPRYREAVIPDDVRYLRTLVIGQDTLPSGADKPLTIGTARIGVGQIKAGGFDSVSAYADLIRFDGNVDLSLGRSIELYQGTLLSGAPGQTVRLAAPYVQFRPVAYVPLEGIPVYPKATGEAFGVLPSDVPTKAQLFVDANMIELGSLGLFGVKGALPLTNGTRAFNLPGFDAATLRSTGDIRVATGVNGSRTLDLIAAQIYPVTGKTNLALATGVIGATERVRFGRSTDTLPDMPQEALGRLNVFARTIEQGGVLRAPLGMIALGSSLESGNGLKHIDVTDSVVLLPGSVTSASANGLLLPYGGTIDGLTYSHAGSALTGSLDLATGLTLGGKSFDVRKGAVIDLSGGGELLGSGFVTGRGGSVDVLTTPLASAGPGYGFSSASNKVYAIVPGAQRGYAPSDPEAGAQPELGRQITVPDGVPGLSAGTYTLMPARYALLPGAFRIELGARTAAAAPQAVATRDGSWLVQGYQGLAFTGYRDALPTRLIVTPGQTVRTHSQYNEMGFAGFLEANAARTGAPLPVLPIDARSLYLEYNAQPGTLPALRFEGEARFTPGTGGQGGILSVDGNGSRNLKLEVVPDSAPTSNGFVSIRDADLNAIGADRMIVGGRMRASDRLLITGFTSSLGIRSGAQLYAPEIFVVGNRGGIVIEDGARLSTLGMGVATPFSPRNGYAYAVDGSIGMESNALILSNGWIDVISRGGNGTSVGMNVGGAELYTEGTLSFAAGGAGKLTLSPELRFGAKYLSFAVPNINFGEQASLDAATRAGVLPEGLILNQQVLNRLLKGNAATGVPKVESLILSAGNAINFFGPVNFDTIDPTTGKSSLAELVLNTPAIYGLGGSLDTARITTDRLVWNGVSDGATRTSQVEPISLPPPAILPGGPGTGSGTLDIAANEIVFGYPKFGLPDTQLTLNRLMLGFSTVNLLASDRITSNSRNTLSVYRSGTDAATYMGGNLNIVTPLLTGDAASINRIAAGGALHLSSPFLGMSSVTDTAMGAEIGLKGQTVTIASNIGLPSGKLTVEAESDIRLEDAARIDLAGRELKFFDVNKYSWGGDLTLASAHGNITQSGGSIIDLSAVRNRAGSLTLTAIDAAAGTVSLGGTILGKATGTYDAGGTRVPYLGASLNVRSQSVDDFAALNRRLNDGGVFGARSFQLQREGLALVIGDELKANAIDVSVDAGTLSVAGRIDASGPQVGTIRLAARDGLTLASTAVLDAHGTQLRVDNRGQVIEAANRAVVELTAGRNLATGVPGWLRLNPGATIDVRSADDVARGTVDLNAQRVDMRGGDIVVDASGPINVRGAKRLALNAFWRYTDAPAGTPSSDGRPTQVINQAYLDRIDDDSRTFINTAWGNAGLQARLTGLRNYGDAFHLRPGVEIASATPDGNLIVENDLDFSGYRYGPRVDASVRGSGEPGVLWLRAGGDLTIKGSINDGFAPPPATPDDTGWMITGQVHAGDILPDPYDGTAPGRPTVFERDYVFPDDCWDCIVITNTGEFYMTGMTVPAGSQAEYIYLPAGMPSPMTYDTSVQRPEPGKVWAVAPMLAPGTRSWTLQLAAGADIGSVNSRSLQVTKRGDLVLDDEHFSGPDRTFRAMSVVRTGTGDLSLLAGGDFSMKSLFGVYTAGTQSAPVLAADGSNPYNLARGVEQQTLGGGGTTVLGANGAAYESLVSGPSGVYQAWYPEQGGNVLVKAQGNVTGFTASTDSTTATANTGNWLWRQGGDVGHVPAAWWINFGTYAIPVASNGTTASRQPRLVGFSGIGALGGGNVDIRAGGDAGVVSSVGDFSAQVTQGLNVAVGGTGRVTDDGRWVMTGGGDLSIRVGGSLNPLDPNLNKSSSTASLFVRGNVLNENLVGTLTNLRGALDVEAGAIGRVDLGYGTKATQYIVDTRAVDLNAPNGGRSTNGPVLSLGDAAVSFTSRGDLVVTRANDPGRALQPNTTPYRITTQGTSVDYRGGGYSWFSLWNDRTSLDLFAAGGNLTPTTIGINDSQTYSVGDYPSTLRAVAAQGGIYYGARLQDVPNDYTTAVMLAPSPVGQLELLARKSIQVVGVSLDLSGADKSVVATPMRPGFVGYADRSTNVAPDLPVSIGAGALYAFGPNTITGNLHAGDLEPQRFYAVDGDIVGLLNGEVLDFTNNGASASPYSYNRWNVAAKSAWIIAGRDIVGAGMVPRAGVPFTNPTGAFSSYASGNLIYHLDATNVSVVRAGRDILQANFQIAGPGTLEVSAGRNLYQGDNGSITSLGPIAPGDSRSGASIVAMAGVGPNGPDYTALKRYLDPANRLLADAALGATGPVAKTYEGELATWLKSRYGFSGTTAESLAYFDALSPDAQSLFLRQVFYAELKAGGREYNDADSRRHGSYLRGRNAIAALFPETLENRARTGDITMFGPSGIHTNFGGDIEMLAPSGKIVAGVPGVVPPASSGIVTQGEGDINLYSRGSVLLGLSRIMTTFGGSILAWSAEGDINAGRGSKTTVLYTPPKLTYDGVGNVTLSSQAPATGAGIATLAPIAEVPAGDVDLIAPLGTIDAGEAGIRVSGNANLAALQVVNAENIQVQGKSTGIPTIAAVNVGALTNASSTAAQAASAAQDAVARDRAATRQSRPSIFNVRMLGGGSDGAVPSAGDPRRTFSSGAVSMPPQGGYDAKLPVQVLGHGKQFDPALMSMLNDDERSRLKQER